MPREVASNWYRVHMRQARWFGVLTIAVGFLALSWPLVLSIAIENTSAIIALYVVALLLDGALFVVWLRLALRYRRRAARGELFVLAWIPRAKGRPSQVP